MTRLMVDGRWSAGVMRAGRRVGMTHAGTPLLDRSSNLLSYGAGGPLNNITAAVAPGGRLRLTSESLINGRGIVWPIGTLPAGTYVIHDESGRFTDRNVYLAILDASTGKRLCYCDCSNNGQPGRANAHVQVMTLSSETECLLAAFGKIGSLGARMDVTFMPMLTTVPSTWFEPPDDLVSQPRGGGITADNLIVNGGFERGIDGWTPPKSYRIAETGDDEYVTRAHGGDKWLWLCSNGISDVNGARQTIAVTPGMNYRLSFFRAEAIGYDNSRYAVANVYAADGTKIAGLYMPPPPDSKWREYTLDFTAPADCTEAIVMICGNSWSRIDDVSLVEII